MTKFSEDHLEQLCPDWFRACGYAHAYGPDISCDGDIVTGERTDEAT